MNKFSEPGARKREILVVGLYGVLGTGVLDAAAADPSWLVTTAARPPPTYRSTTADQHIAVDLMDREGTIKTLNLENLGNVRQSRWDPMLLPSRAVDGRWTVGRP
jgi:hypothetical protein